MAGIAETQTLRVGQLELTFLVDESSGIDSIVMFEYMIPPYARVPAPHYHRDVDEVVHATDGTLTVTLDGTRRQLTPGETLVIPRGRVHYFENVHDTPARGLTIMTPGSIPRRYFEEVAAELSGGRPDPAKIKATMRRYGLIPVEEPSNDAGAEPESSDAAIAALVTALQHAWNAHDPQAWTAQFRPDATLTNVFGIEIVGRDEILRTHRQIMTTMFRDSRTEMVSTSVRYIRRDVASVTVRWKMWGAYDLHGKPWPERDGLMALVLTSEGGAWRVATLHNMDLPKAATIDEMKTYVQRPSV